MALERQTGTLQERPLATLFMELSAAGATGSLALTRMGVTKTIYFEKGRVIFAGSSSSNDRLGEVLLRRGLLRFADFFSVQELVKPGKKLGTLLVEKGLLPAESLMSAVLEQVRSIILSVFDWEDGEFVYTPESEIPKGIIHMELPVREIVREGISRIDSFNAILKGLGEAKTRFRLSPECEQLLEDWTLGEMENRILAALGEPKTFAVLSELRQAPDIDLARFIWTLRVLGIVQPVSEAEASLDAMMDDAFSGGAGTGASQAGASAGAVMMRPGGRKPLAKSATDEAFDRIIDSPEPETPAKVSGGEEKEVGLNTQPLQPLKDEAESLSPAQEVAPPPPAEQPAEPEMEMEPPAEPPASAAEPAGSTSAVEESGVPDDFSADDLDFGLDADDMEAITPSAQETAAPVEAPPDEISRALADFGIKQKKIIDLLTTKSAEKTASFVGFCLREVRKSHPRLFQGMEPDAKGLLPLDKLLANIRSQKLSNCAAGFKDFHDILTRRAKTWLGYETASAAREVAGLPPMPRH
jgi:hypothetical protein